MLLFNFAITVMPLSLAILAGMLSPFSAAVFGNCINKEPIYGFELIGMSFVSVGIALFAYSKS
jgi:drug/metabolite transporter (DMT)-like permease